MSVSPDIKVIVKSAAHRCEDQTIDCNLDWTVFRLKNYISEHFPVKPAVADQRLIYSGHLLKDDKTLKEIFQPTEQDNFTFTLHLVFSQKNGKDKDQQNASVLSNSTSTNQPMPNSSHVNISQFGFNLTNDPSFDLTNLYVQQMQQYQQMYVNYMTQFLCQNNNAEHPQQSNISNAAYNLPMMMNPMLFNPLFTVPNLADISPLINNSNVNSHSNDSTATTNRLPADQAVNENRAQNENANDVNLQNDVQNNGWLDMFNVFWNILIVFSLLSASYSRTIFVLVVGFCYYFYQSGVFSNIYIRYFGDFAQNVNNRNLPNNEEQLQQMMDNAETPEIRRRDVNNQAVGVSAINNNPTEQHFVINKFRFFWMVISSLFSSLMPHNEHIAPENENY